MLSEVSTAGGRGLIRQIINKVSLYAHFSTYATHCADMLNLKQKKEY